MYRIYPNVSVNFEKIKTEKNEMLNDFTVPDEDD